MSLYNVTRINTGLNTDALNLLVDFKNNHNNLVDEDGIPIPLMDEFSHAKVLYYYETTDTRVIDTYYVVDDRDIIFDRAHGDTDTIYRYKYYGDGKEYFYAVNAEYYINEYMHANPLAVESDLIVLYDVLHHTFNV